MTPAPTEKPRVGLFVTCLVDVMRPAAGFAAVKLLEDAGCDVHVPAAQTCCGQPAWNAGESAAARPIARQVIETFEGFDYTVAPSGSCAGMMIKHFPEMFAGDAAWAARADALAEKTRELMSFLTDVMGVARTDAVYDGAVTYHDSCSGLRELGVKRQPRALLGAVKGLALKEGAECETCCGFGGLFCVKYPDVSARIVDKKVDDILATGADTVAGGDIGCLMNIAGALRARGGRAADISVRHAAEILAGHADADKDKKARP